jgi:hypothetical protein
MEYALLTATNEEQPMAEMTQWKTVAGVQSHISAAAATRERAIHSSESAAPFISQPAVIVDVDIFNAPAPSIDTGVVEESIVESPHLSRFAKLGLNARALPYIGRKDSTPRNYHTLARAKEVTDALSDQQHVSKQGDEDLTELEDMMVPIGIRQVDSGRSGLRHNQPPSAGRLSKYSTGYLNESGWHSINDFRRGTELVSINALPEQLLKAKGIVVPTETIDDEEFRVVTEVVLRDAESPIVDAKYFDRDSYLAHVQHPIKQCSGIQVLGDDESMSESSDPNLDELTGLLGQQSLCREKTAKAGKYKALAPRLMESLPRPPKMKSKIFLVNHGALAARNRGKVKVTFHDNAPDTKCNGTLDTIPEEDIGEPVTWTVVDGVADALRIGQAAPEQLTIRLRCSIIDEIQTHTFKKLTPCSIDWSNKHHIREISKWRNGVFRQYGIPLRCQHIAYLPEETDYLLLLHKKIKAAVEAGHNIKIAGPVPITEAFNKFFVGKVLLDEDGEEQPPREMREEISIKGKLNNNKSEIYPLRLVIRRLLQSKKGGIQYVPIITEDEMLRYQQSGKVVLDDPEDETKNAYMSPKRKRETKDIGEEEAKRAKQ